MRLVPKWFSWVIAILGYALIIVTIPGVLLAAWVFIDDGFFREAGLHEIAAVCGAFFFIVYGVYRFEKEILLKHRMNIKEKEALRRSKS